MKAKDVKKINLNDRSDRLSIRFPEGLIAILQKLSNLERRRDYTQFIINCLYDAAVEKTKTNGGTK